jgi:hypothetical protein
MELRINLATSADSWEGKRAGGARVLKGLVYDTHMLNADVFVAQLLLMVTSKIRLGIRAF